LAAQHEAEQTDDECPKNLVHDHILLEIGLWEPDLTYGLCLHLGKKK
jgi:hypothetical protein